MNIVTLSKAETFDRLNISARRYYLTFLFRNERDKLIQIVFLNFKVTDSLYRKTKKEINDNCKQ